MYPDLRGESIDSKQCYFGQVDSTNAQVRSNSVQIRTFGTQGFAQYVRFVYQTFLRHRELTFCFGYLAPLRQEIIEFYDRVKNAIFAALDQREKPDNVRPSTFEFYA